jgi:D-alanine-D-alanine ligase
MKKKVALIFGGRSSEHEISLRSIKNVFEALDKSKFDPYLIGISKEGSWFHVPDFETLNKMTHLKDKTRHASLQPCSLVCRDGKPQFFLLEKNISFHVDVAFPVLHGTFGEDGTIQGLFKMMNLPFVGCGVLACSIGMDKDIMKRLLDQAGIKNAPSLLLTKKMPATYSHITQKLGSPFFIKPANSGSSVGVYKIKSEADFRDKLPLAFKYDEKVLAEKAIRGREIECSVLGLNNEPKASLPGEIILNHEFYSYEAKYIDPNAAKTQIPADLHPDIQKRIQNLAIQTFQTLSCDGLSRVDFFLDESGDIYVNEINTIPGFTNISMYPKMWEASGITYSHLITELIELGLKKFDREKEILFSFESLN